MCVFVFACALRDASCVGVNVYIEPGVCRGNRKSLMHSMTYYFVVKLPPDVHLFLFPPALTFGNLPDMCPACLAVCEPL